MQSCVVFNGEIQFLNFLVAQGMELLRSNLKGFVFSNFFLGCSRCLTLRVFIVNCLARVSPNAKTVSWFKSSRGQAFERILTPPVSISGMLSKIVSKKKKFNGRTR